MPNLTISKTYTDGEILLEADLDNIKSGIETLINTTKLDDDNIQNNAISTTSIIDNTVTTSLLGTDSITNNKIPSNNITTSKLAANSATTTTILDSAVTSAKLAGLSITSSKVLQSGTNITEAQMLARPVWSSSNVSAYSNSIVGYTQMASVSVSRTGTVTTRPFICFLQPTGTSTGYLRTYGGPYSTGTINYGMRGQFKLDGTVIDNSMNFTVTTTYDFGGDYFEDYLPPGAFFKTFTSSASSFTVTFEAAAYLDTSTTITADNIKLVVVEL